MSDVVTLSGAASWIYRAQSIEVLPDNDVVMQYVKHQGEEQRPDDTSLDIGAFEYE